MTAAKPLILIEAMSIPIPANAKGVLVVILGDTDTDRTPDVDVRVYVPPLRGNRPVLDLGPFNAPTALVLDAVSSAAHAAVAIIPPPANVAAGLALEVAMGVARGLLVPRA